MGSVVHRGNKIFSGPFWAESSFISFVLLHRFHMKIYVVQCCVVLCCVVLWCGVVWCGVVWCGVVWCVVVCVVLCCVVPICLCNSTVLHKLRYSLLENLKKVSVLSSCKSLESFSTGEKIICLSNRKDAKYLITLFGVSPSRLSPSSSFSIALHCILCMFSFTIAYCSKRQLNI